MAGIDPTTLKMTKGDDYSAKITLTDQDTGLPIDITGYEVTFTIKSVYTDTDANAIYQQVVTNHTDPTAGETTISIPNSSSLGFEVRDYVYDVQTKTLGGIVTTILKGTFRVGWDVTRST